MRLRKPKPKLPEVPIYTLTFGIAEVFGGMTSVVLQRSTAFSETDRRRIEILTIDPKLDAKTRTRDLRRDGRIGQRVRIRNIWDDLAGMSNRHLRDFASYQPRKRTIIPITDRLLDHTGQQSASAIDEDGKLLQVDRFRPGGSRYLCDIHDAKERGQPGGRLISVIDRRGRVVGQWTTATIFYQTWIDYIAGGKLAVVINDSGFTGNMLHTYRRDNIVFGQVLHTPHIHYPDLVHSSRVHGGKKKMLPSLDNYDVVATLTQQQHDDMTAAHFAADNVFTVSNTFDGTFARDFSERDKHLGITVARLHHQKRIDHTLEALRILQDRHVPVDFEIYGDGVEAERLKGLALALRLDDRVEFKGFDPAAKDRFLDASFSVLSSRYEGQGLVLLESMAAGCIPVAYDFRYGPASLITHGVDGFLVPTGDVEALADAIDQVTKLPEHELSRMRKAAVEKAGEYTSAAITERWGAVLRTVLDRKKPFVKRSGTAELVDVRDESDPRVAIRFDLIVQGEGFEGAEWVRLSWVGRKGTIYGREPAEVDVSEDVLTVRSWMPIDRIPTDAEVLADIHVDVRIDGCTHRVRVHTDREGAIHEIDHLRIYATKYGNLSLRIDKSLVTKPAPTWT